LTQKKHWEIHSKLWMYPKIAVSLKFLLFYPNPKGDKRNFKTDSVQKWDTPEIKAFHDLILSYKAFKISALEKIVKAWIREKAQPPNKNQ
jgi:hypothetical protein